MAIPRQLTQIAFAAPLDESTEDEVLDPTIGFPVLQNVRQDRRGGVSKRLGCDEISSLQVDNTTSRSEGRRCFAHHGTPCVIGSGRIEAYSESLARNVDCGTVPDVSVEVRALPASIDALYTPTQHDQVVCNGFLVFVYSNVTPDTGAAGANVLVTTADEGLVIREDVGLFGGTDPIFQVGAYGTTVLLVAGAYSLASFTIWKLDCTTAATVSSGWTIVYSNSVGKNTASAALALQSLNDRVVVGFINGSGGTSQVSVMAFDETGLTQNRAIFTNGMTPDTVAVEGFSAGTLWVAWNESLDVKAIGLNPTALGTTTATVATVLTGGLSAVHPPSIVSTSATAASIIAYGGGGIVQRGAWTTVAGVVTLVAGNTVLGATVNGRAFLQGSRLLNLFKVNAVGSASDGSVILADWSIANSQFPPLTLAFPNLASADTSAHVLTMPDGRKAHVVAVHTAAQTQSYALVIYDFEDRLRWRSASHNGATFLSGGLLSYFDGERVLECSFLHAPRNLDVTPDGGGTGPTGIVEYVVQFESVDAAGNLSRSGVSEPFAYTGTGVQLFLTCDPLLLTRRAVVRASLYRTQTSGKVYYLVDTRNALRSDAITFVDSYDDTSLASQPLLGGTGVLPGTNGAPLQREAPPYCIDVASFSGMLVVASGTDLWWSGQTIGGEGTWFSSEQFFLTVDGDGDITALAVQDGTLYVFKERAVWAVAGDAPADNGSSGGLGTPHKIAGDVGCLSASSVVVTSLGIFFQSRRGIELLGRGGSPVWIGEKVQATLAAYPYVTSAVVDERNNLVRFSLARSVTAGLVDSYVYHPATSETPSYETGGGRDLVFDLTLNDWQSVDDKGADNHYPSQDTCVVEHDSAQRYAWLHTDGRLFVETDAWTDNGNWIFMAAETGWFKLAGIQGKQQLNRLLTLARKRSTHGLSIAIGYNYSESYDSAQVFTSDQIDALLTSGWPITQLRHDPNDEAEGMAVRIRIDDAQPIGDGGYGTGQGSTWLALTLDITPKDGPAEVPEEAA